jgi:hypothetical protein
VRTGGECIELRIVSNGGLCINSVELASPGTILLVTLLLLLH